jgi:hypothetical protein
VGGNDNHDDHDNHSHDSLDDEAAPAQDVIYRRCTVQTPARTAGPVGAGGETGHCNTNLYTG